MTKEAQLPVVLQNTSANKQNLRKKKTCFHCGKPGHFIKHCPDCRLTKIQHAMIHAATSNNDDDSDADDDDDDDESTSRVDICGFLPGELVIHSAVMGQSHGDNKKIISQNQKTKSNILLHPQSWQGVS